MYSDSLSWNDILFMLHGAGTTLAITVIAVAIGTALGLVLGIIRAGASLWINIPVGAILDIFRSVPLLIQLILFNSFNSLLGLHWPTFVVGSVTLGINTAAFCTEIVRSGISAVPGTTRRAARSLGLTWYQDMTSIVLPIALRTAFPSWIGLALSVMKDTSIVFWIGIIELLRSSQIVTNRVQEPLLILSIAGLIYFALSFPIARLGAQLEQKWRVQ